MHLYFIITEEMIKTSPIPMRETEVGKFNFILDSYSCVGPSFFHSSGQALNYAQLKGISGVYFICRAEPYTEDILFGIEALLSNNKMSSVRVLVNEVVKISTQ